jgi:hypothetical protein
MKKIIPFLFAFIVLLASCKDEDTTPDGTTELTTAEKVQHTWNLTSIMDFNYVGASTTIDNIDTFDVGTSSTVDFRADNKAYITLDGDFDTTDYNIVDAQTITFDGDNFTIDVLTATEFKLTFSERTDTPYYDNVVLLNR